MSYSADKRMSAAATCSFALANGMSGVWPGQQQSIWLYAGGEQRRLSIACALIATPSIMFLDEPTSGVQPPWLTPQLQHHQQHHLRDLRLV